MKADAHKQVQYLRKGLEQFLATEDKHIANGTPHLRGEQYFALGALTKLSDTQIAASYYKLPTGFGKTVMFSYMVQAYLPQARANGDKKKLVILVPRLNLINQTGKKLDSFAGFAASEFSEEKTDDIPEDIIELAKLRWDAKLNKNWALADEYRNKISDSGYAILDSKDGYKIERK